MANAKIKAKEGRILISVPSSTDRKFEPDDAAILNAADND